MCSELDGPLELAVFAAKAGSRGTGRVAAAFCTLCDTIGHMHIAHPLPPCPAGRTPFEVNWPVRLADTDANDRLRLDAVARYLQDIGFEHLGAVDDGDLHQVWIVRRTVIDVVRPIEFGDHVYLRRWPSALSNRWCNMRIQISSAKGGLIEAEAFLINIDPVAGVPARMTDRFMAPMVAVTTEHRLRWKAVLEATSDMSATPKPFPLRIADFDRLGHVNNAVYWQAVEEELAAHPDIYAVPYRAIVEHVGAIFAGDPVDVRFWKSETGLRLQIEVAKSAKALADITPLEHLATHRDG